MNDTRLLWIRERILKFFNEKDPSLFTDLLERNNGQKILEEFINRDLSDINKPDQRIIFFYKTFYDKIVEEEIIVEEPVINVEKSSIPTPPLVAVKRKGKAKKVKKKKEKEGEDGDGGEGEDEIVDDVELPMTAENGENEDTSKPLKPVRKKQTSKEKMSPRTAVETPPPQADEFTFVKRIIEKLVKTPELHITDTQKPGEFSVYFLRKIRTPVPKHVTYAEARAILPNHFIVGGSKGDLSNFNTLLQFVVSPMIQHQFRDPHTALTRFQKRDEDATVFAQFAPPSFYRRVSLAKHLKSKGEESGGTSAKSELLHGIENLTYAVSFLLEEGEDLTIDIPSSLTEETLDEVVNKVRGWERSINLLVGDFKGRKPSGSDPISEFEFWRETAKGLENSLQQYQKPAVREVINFLANFNQDYAIVRAINDLENFTALAQENVEVLSNIHRFLKIISYSETFHTITATLPELFEGFRLIWILSRHYNNDESMVGLMKRVAIVLCRKVTEKLKPETIFHNPEIISLTNDAYKMLTCWRESYLEKRREIENASIDRWEFDQRKLFAETDYIASVCKDLNEIAIVVKQFLAVFGPDFKSIVTDPVQVDCIVKRVENLFLGVEMTDFDIYKPSCRDNWQAVVDSFYKDVKILEQQVAGFIDQAFTMLRSSQDALELLVKDIETRPIIQQRLLTKFDVLLQELIKEILNTQDEFNRGKKNPPVLRYQPPESGAIFWERMLFLNMKRPIIRFMEIEQCENSPYKIGAFSEYVSVAKQMKEYETMKFEKWCKNALPIAAKALQNSILVLERIGGSKFKQKTARLVSRHSVAHVIMEKISRSVDSKASSLSIQGHTDTYRINFAEEILDVIAEAELMEYLGFQVPTAIRNVALQKDRLHLDLSAVEGLIEEYNLILSSLSPRALQFTRNFILRVQKHILPGCTWLNWNSLGIQNYVENAHVSLKHLRAVLRLLQLVEDDLSGKIDLLKTFNLFDFAEIKNCSEFFVGINAKRNVVFERILEIFEGFGPILIKLESLVHHSNTGHSEHMELFYHYWDELIQTTFTDLVVENLEKFNKSLLENVIFQVSVTLSPPDVLLDPTSEDLYNTIMTSAMDCAKRFHAFPRWQPNTCLMTEDRSFNVEAGESLETINKTAHNLSEKCRKTLSRWKKYSNLWLQDVKAKCDRFASRNPSLSDYDEKFTYYTSLSQDLKEVPCYEDVQAVRLDLNPIIKAIDDFCRLWKQTLGDRLAETTKTAVTEFQTMIDDLFSRLGKDIQSLDDLKQVLLTISTIQKSTVSSEIKYEEFQEIYHTLRLHQIQVSIADVEMSESVKTKWRELYVTSLIRDGDLKSTKETFAAKTVEEITEFLSKLDNFADEYNRTGFGDDLDEGLLRLEKYQQEFDSLESKKEELLIAEALFGLPATDYNNYLAIKSHFDDMQRLFNIFQRLKTFQETSAESLWVSLNTSDFEKFITELTKSFRQLEENLRRCSSGYAVEKSLKEFKTVVSLMVELKSDSLVDRHWQKLMSKTGVEFDLAADKFKLKNIYAMELFRHPGFVEEIIARSEREAVIDANIKTIKSNWQKITFSFVPHYLANEPRGFVISEVTEIIQAIENDAMALQAMSASEFIGPFMKILSKLERDLALYADVIEIWLKTQRKWVYLEAIFIAGDVRTQLPDEAKKFDDIDRNFRRIMTESSKRPHVKDCCEADGRFDELETLHIGLEKCQKSLIDYLQVKRNSFPRFYFISDDELLSILGNSDPKAIQPHIAKIFDNITALILTGISVTGLISSEGEILTFEQSVLTEGKIELWMANVLKEMKASNRFITKKAIFDYGKERKPIPEWMKNYPGMVSLAASQVWWTAQVDDSFGDLKKYLTQLNAELNELVLTVKGDLVENHRKIFNTALILAVHNRDIVEKFVKMSLTDPGSFEWESQLRFYWSEDNLSVRQCLAGFEYGYEYLGLSGRLVITPLTHRIYLTITQALSMHLGCAPAGPAGTGKTETVKDLAKSLAILCIVTNCGQSMDYKSVGKILTGLCQSGAWGCFDEFNRIDISALSVISSQLHCIRHALLLKLPRFNLDQEISLDRKVGVFITMNPGYAGRTELPESIKALFRPVVCVMPDFELICQILLFSTGFLSAKLLAKKISVLYSIAQEQLSQQSHYDFGLRAVKSVLVKAGESIRTSHDPNEELLLIQALKDINLPKMVRDDVPLFLGIIQDLFPNVESEKTVDENLESSVETARITLGLEKIPSQVEKVMQLYETTKNRHSVMLVGPSGAGKTVILLLYQETQNILNFPTSYQVINPKACTVDELYGFLDPNTREWTDGVLSSMFRDLNQGDRDGEHDIIFDGDVDALWIENMNSVMDDNKLLTLVNGERIRLQNHRLLLFEVGDLFHASPATVSRAGIVYVDISNMDTRAFWNKWLATRENVELLDALYNKYVDSVARFVLHGWSGVVQGKSLKQIVLRSELNMVRQLCDVLDAMSFEDESLECLFIQALYYSFGASLVLEERERFDDFVKNLSGLIRVDDTPEKKAGMRFLPNAEKTLFEYFVEGKSWVAWKWITPDYIHRGINFNNILVPTVDTTRAEWLLKTFSHKPFILVGETGTSKTGVINGYMRNLPAGTHQKLKINFSAQTTANSLRRNLESAVSKRTKHVYGPPLGSKLVVFIDDLNMPKVDEYGTQQPIAFLKYLIEFGGFWDVSDFISLTETYLVAAMGRPGGGRAVVDPRFLSKFAVFNMAMPSEETTNRIYNSILTGHTADFSEDVRRVIPSLVASSIELITKLSEDLPATPKKFHYIFNTRELSRVCCGLCQSSSVIFKTAEAFTRLWRNEVKRVFCDKLISLEDVSLVEAKINEYVMKLMPHSSETILRDPILFGDFRNASREGEPRLYEDLLDFEAVYYLFEEILEEFQETRGFKMVLFEHAIEHLVRIHRVLRLHRGHMMLIGSNGSGKRSMTKLASFAAGCDFFEVTITRSYNLVAFVEDVKKLYVSSKPTVFILGAAEILEDSFLDILNTMLSVGVTTSLFSDEEREEIIEKTRSEHGSMGKEELWDLFSDRCNENVHIVFTTTPGDALRTWCRNFPGLINNTTINWVFPWPKEALSSVGQAYLSENPEVPERYRKGVVKHMVYVHGSLEEFTKEYLRRNRGINFVAPKQYLSYIEMYLTKLKTKNEFISLQKKRLAGGIRKLAEAQTQLDGLHGKLKLQKAAVEGKTAACENLLEIIKKATEEAQEKKLAAMQKKKDVEEQERIIKIEQSEAEDILNKALPALDAAKKSLNDLDKADITEIRSFPTPPQAVQIVCECVLHLLGVKDVSWKSAKAVMADPYFLMKLRDLNCDQINLTQQRLCRSHAKNLPPDLKASSSAAHGLMMYVHAVLGYCDKLREIKPKKEKVEQLERDKVDSQIALKNLEEEIAHLEIELEDLNARYEKAVNERTELEDEADLMMKRFSAAGKLMSGLSSENLRWNRENADLDRKKIWVIGDCLLAAAFLTYTGPFNAEFRGEMILNWRENLEKNSIPMGEVLEKFLCTDVEVSEWNAEGLPADNFSLQNGILTLKSSKFPFFIDPQKQAIKWLRKRHEKDLKSTTFRSPDYLKQLEMALQYGSPLIIDNIEDFIDPIISNVIEKNYIVKGGHATVQLGEKTIDVHPKFSLYLASHLTKPRVDPSMYCKATVINCTVTDFGLQEQLLTIVVRNERPELETTRERLIQETFQFKSALKGCEDALLRELTAASGNMLDNQELVEALEEAKINSAEIAAQLLESQRTSGEIDLSRNEYRAVAKRGSILYFALLDMATVNSMYQYSLRAFLEVFTVSLKMAGEFAALQDRLAGIINILTKNVFEFGCLGLFERDKLLFSLQIALKLEMSRGHVTQAEVNFLTRGNLALEEVPPCPDWITRDSWVNLHGLANACPEFTSLLGGKNWHDFYETTSKVFHKVLLLKCFHPERVISGIKDYITDVLGSEFSSSPPVDLMKIYQKSTPTMPVIFILSPGSDPTDSITDLAEICGMGGRFRYVSLGQGQEEVAMELLNSAAQQGHWVLLQNCHLLVEFIREIEIPDSHPDFRLWLTTEPTGNFPVDVLQKSLKVVAETPHGLKSNLRKTLSGVDATKLSFVLAFFHAVVLERRKYGRIGFNLMYDFSDTDFKVSLTILSSYLNRNEPWESLRFLIGEIIYGGRVSDDYDRRIVKTYMEEYFGDFLFDRFQSFYFYKDESFSYIVPDKVDEYIESLPFVDKPAIFGLHPNAEINYYINYGKEIFGNLISMCGETIFGESEEIEAIVGDILAKIPEPFDSDAIRQTFEMNLKPGIIVLLQELKRFNLLIEIMKNSLISLRKALKGESEMDENLERVARSLVNGEIPQIWREISPETKKSLASWLQHFLRRTTQLSEWSRGAPIVIWLAGLHKPESYLTALIQTASRENGWPLDKCVLSTSVSEFVSGDEVEKGLEQGCYVEGLFLEGARWDSAKGCLMPPNPGILLERLPVLKVVPVEVHRLKTGGLRTPVYVTSNRRNAMGRGLAFEADLTIREHASFWILGGVCLLLNDD